MPTLRLEPQHPSHAALRASQLQVQDAEPFQGKVRPLRSEEHTSELQSRLHLVCRLLLEKKKETPGRPRLHLGGGRGPPGTLAGQGVFRPHDSRVTRQVVLVDEGARMQLMAQHPTSLLYA